MPKTGRTCPTHRAERIISQSLVPWLVVVRHTPLSEVPKLPGSRRLKAAAPQRAHKCVPSTCDGSRLVQITWQHASALRRRGPVRLLAPSARADFGRSLLFNAFAVCDGTKWKRISELSSLRWRRESERRTASSTVGQASEISAVGAHFTSIATKVIFLVNSLYPRGTPDTHTHNGHTSHRHNRSPFTREDSRIHGWVCTFPQARLRAAARMPVRARARARAAGGGRGHGQ